MNFFKMPLNLFGNKFSPKKTPPRRAQSLSNISLDADQAREEFGPNIGPVKLRLGGNEVQFENGMWIQETGGGGGASHKEVMKLRKENQQVSEENNLLKLKIDILLDMLAEASAVSHYHETELKQMRAQVGKKR
ncbi:protein chibby homolog 1-like isoform X1 [Mytilus galloprovincialis]|uniref:protein chibby homolog 1-like isoform X1 n=2 Tax=Mytilus galloprovincialis TaxID=29158 RepID=UPI003F7CAC8A